MIESCVVGLRSAYCRTDMGLLPKEIVVTWSTVGNCIHYCQDILIIDFPFKRSKVCGNCIHYIVIETEEVIDGLPKTPIRELALQR